MSRWIGAVSAAAVCIVAVAPFGAPPKLHGDPCGAVGIFLCRFLPFEPDLEEDIDLTKQHPPTAASGPPDNVVPGGNICAGGCV